jgi:hypothetical protein
MALSIVDKIPVWDDPRNNKPTQQLHKKIASHLRIAIPRAVNEGSLCYEDLHKMTKMIKDCRDFKEVCEFRGVMDAIETGLNNLVGCDD